MPLEYLTDGELGFIGLNSRDNPASLDKGILSKSVNFRLDRGVATTRKGLKKYTEPALYGATKSVVGSGVYLNATGQEIFILLIHDSAPGVLNPTKLYEFNPDTGTFAAPSSLPVSITSSSGVDIIQAVDNVFISRGHDARPIRWDKVSTFEVLPTNHEFPNSTGLLFYQNRIIAIGRHLSMAATERKRDTVCVSHFLEYDKWPALDAFTINQGGNDEVIALVPWTMNEFLVLCRNSTFYLNVGSDRYTSGQALSSTARLESLSVDIGCVARKTAVQVGSGVMFLSDNGIYALEPTKSGQPDGVKLLTLSDPISANVDDIIQRINKDYASQSVAAYWNNRYYIAVPLDNSTKNNTVLVYNFILKNWESVDQYGDEIDIFSFAVGKRDTQRRLYIVDRKEGILLNEELQFDEYGPNNGTPMLSTTPVSGPYVGLTGAYVPFTLTTSGFLNKPIYGEIQTRRFTAGDGRDKRFSSIECDILSPAGSIVETYAVTNNPDTDTKIDEFVSPFLEDATRRNPVRKIAYGLQIKFVTSNLQPTIRSNFVKFTGRGKTNINKQ